MKITLVSGGFDPLHSGHIRLIESAASLGDYVIVGLNSDDWLIRKKGKAFLSFDERETILRSLRLVNEVQSFDDSDDTACDFLINVRKQYPDADITFCNGGDRKQGNVPEESVEGISFVFDAGGNEKINSSSTILSRWANNIIERDWGIYSVLYDRAFQSDQHVKVKELVVEAGKGISLQKHFHRNEFWLIAQGECTIFDGTKDITLGTNDFIFVPKETKHQIKNVSENACHIIEIQYGNKCIEEDIERFNV